MRGEVLYLPGPLYTGGRGAHLAVLRSLHSGAQGTTGRQGSDPDRPHGTAHPAALSFSLYSQD